jgi:hypothetical protein
MTVPPVPRGAPQGTGERPATGPRAGSGAVRSEA